MAKKYLSLEEAAARLGISEDRLRRAREQGEIRGFADRGNWKFREDDVLEYGRTQEFDSSPDLPLYREGPTEDSTSVLDEDDEAISEQPTKIRRGSDSGKLADDFVSEGASDSGVRLVLDEGRTVALPSEHPDESMDSSHDIPISFGDSSQELTLDADSDESSGDSSRESFADEKVKLGEGLSAEVPLSLGDSDQEFALSLDDDSSDASVALSGSDSDVRLAVDPDDESLADSSSEAILTGKQSDSDVRLVDQPVPFVDPGSDSDVRLIRTDSDSDVKLASDDSDSDVRLLPVSSDSDSDVSLSDRTDPELPLSLASDSGVALSVDSGLSLDVSEEEGDSAISLDVAGDSGISLDMADDSGIALDVGSDSDVSLATDAGATDESITLEVAPDSGISLDMPADSGISLDEGTLDATMPMMKTGGRGGSTADSTAALDSFDDESVESDFELGALEGESSSDTSVLLFDDGDESATAPVAAGKKARATSGDEETFDLQGGESLVDEEDEELLGEDDEIEDFVDEEFMADEEDFEESFSAGESHAEFVAPAAGGAMRLAVEQEWGGLVFATVLVSSILMLVCCGVMFDLVRYMWKAGEYGAVSGPLISIVGK